MRSLLDAISGLFGAPKQPPFRDGRRVIFCHVQKTGGTSLRESLAAGIPDRHLYPSRRAMAARGGAVEPEAAQYAAQPRSARSKFWLIADHLQPCVFDQEPDDPLFVTVVREPVARAVSHLVHARRLWPAFQRRSLLQLLDHAPARKTIVENLQVRFFAADTLQQAIDQMVPRPVGRADLMRALERIAAMDAVGVTEQLDASAALIGAAVGRPELAVRRVNVSKPDDRAEAADPRLHARVAEAIDLDRDFYLAVKARFERDIAARQNAASV